MSGELEEIGCQLKELNKNIKESGELEEIGYQLKELNKNVKELNDTFSYLSELSSISTSIDGLLDIQKEYMDIQKGIITGDDGG